MQLQFIIQRGQSITVLFFVDTSSRTCTGKNPLAANRTEKRCSIPASSVTDYVPARDDLLFRGIISEEKELHEIQTLPNKHTITAVADCRYGSAAVQHIEVTAN